MPAVIPASVNNVPELLVIDRSPASVEPSTETSPSAKISSLPSATLEVTPVIDELLIAVDSAEIVDPPVVTVVPLIIIEWPEVRVGLAFELVIVGHEFIQSSEPTNTQPSNTKRGSLHNHNTIYKNSTRSH